MSKLDRFRSPLWTAFLLPFLFLPYRWLWLPCAIGAACLVSPKQSLRGTLKRDGTIVVGPMLVLMVRTLLDPAWWLPWLGIIFVAFLLRARRPISRKTGRIGAAALCILSLALLGGLDYRQLFAPNRPVDPSAVLICAGDSLTSGVDFKSDAQTYVAALRRSLPGPVLNAGRANDRVGDLHRRLERDVLSKQPRGVLLFIGGNDYLDGTPRREFAETLDQVAERIAASGARLVIVEVPTGIVWDPYAGIYRKVAHRHGARLVPESQLRIWFSVELLARDYLREPLTIDGIHLSPAGAKRVAKWLLPSARWLSAPLE